MRPLKNLAFTILVVLIVISLFDDFKPQKSSVIPTSYSSFLKKVELGNVKSAILTEHHIEAVVTDKEGKETKVSTYAPNDPQIYQMLYRNNVDVQANPPVETPFWVTLLVNWFPWLLLIGFWIYMIQKMQGGGRSTLSFAKSKAKMDDSKDRITFKDVAGIEESKEEVVEIIEFLRNPKKFVEIGAKIPRGVLLIGPPGTGKTLLAKAISGEADVPFFNLSGSDFVEMFVGVGAARVRDLFETAKKHSPCIIFIDEIDAVGRHRGSGLGGGHDEREQTLNQLLVEMDGFDNTKGIILIAATNRPDVLDSALLRPGRFDRQIVIPLPDVKGRIEILKVHGEKIKLNETVDLKILARGTPGFSGADLANVLNEAALLAARKNKLKVSSLEIDEAKDKVMMGPARKSRVIPEQEKINTAYHEAGHALLALLLSGCDPLHKVTIIPRGMAGGLTHTLPAEDKQNLYKSDLLDEIVMAYGGRAAEMLMFDEFSYGAVGDINFITSRLRKMCCEWGMTEELGCLSYSPNEEHIFLGREISRSDHLSPVTLESIDHTIRELSDRCYQRAFKLLESNKDKLVKLAENLLIKETLTGSEVEIILDIKKNNKKKREYEYQFVTPPVQAELPEENIVDIVEISEQAREENRETSEESEVSVNVENDTESTSNERRT